MKARVSKLQNISTIFKNSDTSSELFLCLYLSKNWQQIIGKKWAQSLKVKGYKNQCIWIQLPSSCHIQEMNFHKEEIITQINKSIPSVKDIRWII